VHRTPTLPRLYDRHKKSKPEAERTLCAEIIGLRAEGDTREAIRRAATKWQIIVSSPRHIVLLPFLWLCYTIFLWSISPRIE
jgi:hypothetical protein